jgi:hypothetical protein
VGVYERGGAYHIREGTSLLVISCLPLIKMRFEYPFRESLFLGGGDMQIIYKITSEMLKSALKGAWCNLLSISSSSLHDAGN